MCKKSFFLPLTLLIVACLSATARPGKENSELNIRGKLVDENNSPLPYASIFFKHHPSLGTVSDSKGQFSIVFTSSSNSSVSEEDIRNYIASVREDTLMFSMLGYQTLYMPVSGIRDGKNFTVKMNGQALELDAAIVLANPKNSRKEYRKTLRAIIDKIYDRYMNVDYTDASYKIASDISVMSGENVAAVEHVTGTLVQMPHKSSTGRDSIRIDVDDQQSFLAEEISEGIKSFDMSKLNKKEKKAIGNYPVKSWGKTLPHVIAWKADLHLLLNQVHDDNVKYWGMKEKDDTTLLISYLRTYNYIGILKAEQKFTMAVDSRTYAIQNISHESSANLNLPFGYKLSEAQLAALNIVNFGNENIEKYKIKKADANIKGTILMQNINGKMEPLEKNLVNDIGVVDNNDKAIRLHNKCSVKVLEVLR